MRNTARTLQRVSIVVFVACAIGCGGGAEVARTASSRAVRDPLVTTELEVASGDATLHVWSRGGGPQSSLLVLINGGPGLSHHAMIPLQDALATPARCVITYDQRGVGRSTATGIGRFRPEDYVADLEAIRAAAGRDRIDLLGHSFGGMIALSYTDAHPDRVASLVVAGTGVSDPDAMAAGGALFGARVAALQHAGVIPDPVPSATCSDRYLALMPAYFADPSFQIPDVMRQRECDDTGRSDVLFAFIATPYAGGLARTRARTLVLIGDREPFGPSASRYVVSALSGTQAELVTLPQCGHIGWLECERPFLSAVRAFLADGAR